MPEREIRTAYSALRSILRKRNERTEALGILTAYPTPPKVRDVPKSLLKYELADLASAVRDPATLISKVKSRERKIAQKLAEHHYDIPAGKLDDFGRFMEATRKRQGATYKGKSGVAARAYEELVKTGVTGKTIARSFKAWLEDTESLNTLINAAQNAQSTHPGKRVTGVELREIMQKIDPIKTPPKGTK